ncbi:hypothetical protein LPJ57_003203 [Coemansia sp. RSA 486]|nr:hypothetical protein LPJ57_003203 [Coemansia sp. RSA 486]KAJ2225817.1 hypothetical protein IWW45_007721 [Coemansia sp. RSA 485]KAJ2603425.1 hypothetical protein GGF39_000149 [Coemansia sp. RSA 1721]KAJ2636596.1 hypothetical protein GGF40_002903 [Coemansia sp. RSA 1286]
MSQQSDISDQPEQPEQSSQPQQSGEPNQSEGSQQPESSSQPSLDAHAAKHSPLGGFFQIDIKKLNTKCERRLRSMSGVLRSKSDWIQKLDNPDIRGRWEAEAQAQGLTAAETAYVFEELRYYATLHTPDSSVKLGAVEQVWISDSLIDKDVEEELLRYSKVLEDVPEKDWHPGSNNQVLNLIHPSMYPLVYAQSSFVTTPIADPQAALRIESFGVFPGNIEDWDREIRKAYPREPVGDTAAMRAPYSVAPNVRTASQQFCWLPTEFYVDDNGEATVRSYINNLHPVKHAEFYPTIAAIFGKFVPLLENVVTDLIYPRKPRVIPDCSNWLVEQFPEPTNYRDPDYDEKYREWEDSQLFIEPVPEPFETPERPPVAFSLKGRRLQAIVKMANIVLTPENPVYAGGSWHVEALSNERIIATGIYYYDVENITESSLAFREMVDEEIDYEQSDQRGLDLAYGIFTENNTEGERDDSRIPISQEIGGVTSEKGRCIVFPNTYQHRVSGFELADKTKPGHRKILAFFFIDPINPIVSTEIVPPQQQDWWRESVEQVQRIHDLPLIVRDGVFNCVDFPIPLEDAKKTRLELMQERTANSNSTGEAFYTPEFNFCEH